MGRDRAPKSAVTLLSGPQRAFLTRRRIGHLATADMAGRPTVVPVCFALEQETLYTALDDKPKRTRRSRRILDLEANSRACFICDCYDEDWSKLGWVMIRGEGEILHAGREFDLGCTLLRRRYVQYESMILSPVIVIRIKQVHSWGSLDG